MDSKLTGVSVMRLLRVKYGISIRELAEAAGVSHQYVSDVEFGKFSYESSNTLMQQAFDKVISRRSRQAAQLSEAFAKYRLRLLEFVEETDEL